MRAFVVIDLGFGDAGKGLLTDYLVRRQRASVVVRFNGGAQAGHNVVGPDGRHHTFAQIGAGSFVSGVRTFLSRHVVVHPTALVAEAAVLGGALGGSESLVEEVLSRVCISENARLVTPFHQAAGRLRELARGPAGHGTCGAGVGETVRDGLAYPGDAVVAGDLCRPETLRRKLAWARERLAAEVAGAASAVRQAQVAAELAIFAADDIAERWMAAAARVAARVAADETLARWLAGASAVVFEGAQGVLLDEWLGFHPYTTWSTCTAANALELLAEAAPGAGIERIGVLRCHAVRHGPGPLPTESAEPRAAIRDHNRTGAWQGDVRYGWFDAVLARYALDVAGPVERLAVTHLDVPARLGRWQIGAAYLVRRGRAAADRGEGRDDLAAERDPRGGVIRIAPPGRRDLARQERLTAWLGVVDPVYAGCDATAEAVLRQIELQLGRQVDYRVSGPTAAGVAEAAREF